ncbi:hypothetical protein ACT7DZ_01865 [Bacillus cereus]
MTYPLQIRSTTNTVTTTVQNDNVIAIKSVDVTNALPGQTLRYTITITNSGNVTIEDLLATRHRTNRYDFCC